MKKEHVHYLKELEPHPAIQKFRIELANQLGYIDEGILLERLYHLGKDYYKNVEENKKN